MKFYRIHVKNGIENPEDWSRVLITFAYGGLRIEEEFSRDCIVQAGPLVIRQLGESLSEYVEVCEYDDHEREKLRRDQRKEKEEEEKMWW